jgi:hypothetical protein
MEEGVLEEGDTIWWCPLPLDKLNLRKLESPQSNESRRIVSTLPPPSTVPGLRISLIFGVPLLVLEG